MPRRPKRRPEDDLARVILDLLFHMPAPAMTLDEALLRNRAAQARLGELALRAADARWRGFQMLASKLIEQEADLLQRSVVAKVGTA